MTAIKCRPSGGIMRIMRQASLITLCIALIFAVSACSGGGSPVAANPNSDLSNYASSITGTAFTGETPVTSGHVFVYDLETFTLFNEADIDSNGSYAVGVDAGQYLVIPVSPEARSRPRSASTMEHVPSESQTRHRGDGLPRRAHRGVSTAVCLVRDRTRTAKDHPIRCHRASDVILGHAAASRGLSRRYGSTIPRLRQR